MRTTRRSIFEDDWVWLPQGARGREIYIGRGSLKRGVPRSKWANPFVIGVDGNRPGVINLFRDYARKTFSEKDLADIRGKCLVCHCRFHETCHGDVLADMAGNLAPTKESELLEDGLPLKTGCTCKGTKRTAPRRTKQARKTWTEKQRRGEVGWDADPQTLDVYGEAEDLHRWRRALLPRTLAPQQTSPPRDRPDPPHRRFAVTC